MKGADEKVIEKVEKNLGKKALKTFRFILLLSVFFSTGLSAQNEANVCVNRQQKVYQ